ncbi:hypothetical protein BAE44_0006352, partial [Dichanthelium oligosanthes]
LVHGPHGTRHQSWRSLPRSFLLSPPRCKYDSRPSSRWLESGLIFAMDTDATHAGIPCVPTETSLCFAASIPRVSQGPSVFT